MGAAPHRGRRHHARADGVELLLFPELSLTGYRLGEDILRVALARDDPLILELAAYE